MTADQLFVVAILAVIVGPVVNWITSYIQRMRDLADRAAKDAKDSAERQQVASDLKASVLANAQAAQAALEATKAVTGSHSAVIDAVKEVGVQAKAAYDEANTVNVKIAKTNDAMVAQQEILKKLQEQLKDGLDTKTTGAAPAVPPVPAAPRDQL